MSITYHDIDKRIEGFIFELDNVLYPEKDYLFQVYYLFANFIEYTEQIDAKPMITFMTSVYEEQGKDAVFNAVQKEFSLDLKYGQNLQHLMLNAKLPLKLLLYNDMLNLLQDIVVDRKRIFIVTNGNPQMQLNKIKQTEWNGLEQYLTCYFANEFAPKPEPDAIHALLHDHHLQRRQLMMIGREPIDERCAEASGIDFLHISKLVSGQ